MERKVGRKGKGMRKREEGKRRKEDWVCIREEGKGHEGEEGRDRKERDGEKGGTISLKIWDFN